MEANDKKEKSLFDILEEKCGSSEQFAWRSINALFTFSSEEYLFSGSLITFGIFSRTISSTYILTLDGLYKCKSNHKVIKPKGGPIEITERLKINNARIRRIEDKGSGMYKLHSNSIGTVFV